MEANTFWENYKAAYEWQKRHNVTWWKTRCFALEYENHMLRETIRNLTQNSNYSSIETNNLSPVCKTKAFESDTYQNENDTNENFEFQLNEDMMDFLAQSIRHKIELKNKRKKETATQELQKESQNPTESVLVRTHKRNENAKLLYGEASSKILAMEIALQTSVERHMDKTKPLYWPNIPLKL